MGNAGFISSAVSIQANGERKSGLDALLVYRVYHRGPLRGVRGGVGGLNAHNKDLIRSI